MMEAAGAHFVPDDIWRVISENNQRALKEVSSIIYINTPGETRDDIILEESFIKNMLKARIAIVEEDLIRAAIMELLILDRDAIMMQSFTFWLERFHWNVPERVFEYIVNNTHGKEVLEEWDDKVVAPPRRSTNSARSRETSLILLNDSLPGTSTTDDSPDVHREKEVGRDKRHGNNKDDEQEEKIVAKKTFRDEKRKDLNRIFDSKTSDLQSNPIKLETEQRRSSISERSSSPRNSEQMEDMDEYLGSDDLLGEALREIEMGDSNVEQEYNDSPVTVFIPGEQEGDIEVNENYGMMSFSFASGPVPDDVISSLASPSDWVDTVPHLSIFIPQALARTGLDTGTQSEDSVFYFNDMWKELEKHTPASLIHNMMCKDLVAFIRNSSHHRFCPVENVMSKLFNCIGKPAYGMEMDADQSVFRLIHSLLRTFPPSNTGGRYYWLQVLSDFKSQMTKVSKKKVKKETDGVKEEKELTERTAAFRKLVLDSFTDNGTSLNMQEFLVNVLEADLFGLRAEGDKESKPVEERRKSLGRVQVKGFSDDLKDVPLAFLIFYEANDKRRRGLSDNATTKVLQIVDFLKENEHEPRVRAVTSRLLCVLLEALRWFSSQVSQVFEGNALSYELQSDVKRIGRQFTKNGFYEWEVAEMMPIAWIQEHMFDEK